MARGGQGVTEGPVPGSQRALTMRATPAQLQSVFPMANANRLADLPGRPGRRSGNVLNIGVSATVLFDHGYTGPADLDAFRQFMVDQRDVPMRLKPTGEWIAGLLDCNYLTAGAVPLVTLHLATMLGDAATERLIVSLLHYGFEQDLLNDFIATSQYTASEDYAHNLRFAVSRLAHADLDFFFAGKESMAVALNQKGVGAGVLLDHPDPDTLPAWDPLQPRLYATDGDGAGWSDHYEKRFQEIFAQQRSVHTTVDEALVAAKRVYYEYLMQERGESMVAGPVTALFRGLSTIAGLFDETDDQPLPLYNMLVTTRELRGAIAMEMFLAQHGVTFHGRDYRSGQSKNLVLGGVLAMFEDDPKHLQRTFDMPAAERPRGLVHVPHGIKFEMTQAGQEVVSDGRGTVDLAGRTVLDVGSTAGQPVVSDGRG